LKLTQIKKYFVSKKRVDQSSLAIETGDLKGKFRYRFKILISRVL
jgi:hypothetical protein